MVVFHRNYSRLLLLWTAEFCIHNAMAQSEGTVEGADITPDDSPVTTATDVPVPALAASAAGAFVIIALVSFWFWRRRRGLASTSSTGHPDASSGSGTAEKTPFGEDETMFGSNTTTFHSDDEGGKKWLQQGPPPVPLPAVDISLPMPPQSTYLFADKLELGTGDESLFLKFLRNEEHHRADSGSANDNPNSSNRRTSIAVTLRNTLRQSLRRTASNKDPAKRVPLRDVAFDVTPASVTVLSTPASAGPSPSLRRSISMKKKPHTGPQPDIKIKCSSSTISGSHPPISAVEKTTTTVTLPTMTASAEETAVVIATTRTNPNIAAVSSQSGTDKEQPDKASAKTAADRLIQAVSVQTKHRADERTIAMESVKATPIYRVDKPLPPRVSEALVLSETYDTMSRPLDNARAPVPAPSDEDIHSAPENAPSSMSVRRRSAKVQEKITAMDVFGGKEDDQEIPDENSRNTYNNNDRIDPSVIASKCQLNDNNSLPPAVHIQDLECTISTAADSSLDDGSAQHHRDDPPVLLLQQTPNQSDTLEQPVVVAIKDLPRTGSVQNIISWWQKESSVKNNDSEQSSIPSVGVAAAAFPATAHRTSPGGSPTSSLPPTDAAASSTPPPPSKPLGPSCASATSLPLPSISESHSSLSQSSIGQRDQTLANRSSDISNRTQDGTGSVRRAVSQQHLQSSSSHADNNNHSSSSNSNGNNGGGGLMSLSKRAQVRTIKDELPSSSLQDAPMPTASFSSSTVNTMIPADDYPGRSNPIQQRQQTAAAAAATGGGRQKPGQVTSAQQQAGTTQAERSRQPQGSIPCMMQGNLLQQSDSRNSDKKTPAQQEKDRYLKSLE